MLHAEFVLPAARALLDKQQPPGASLEQQLVLVGISRDQPRSAEISRDQPRSAEQSVPDEHARAALAG